MAMTRKELLRSAAVMAGGGLVLNALGCGGQSTSCGATIALNHGHSLAVPRADAQAGADKTYSIRGGADHDHTILLTAGQFADLLAGSAVVVTSSPDTPGLTHDHEVTVTCT